LALPNGERFPAQFAQEPFLCKIPLGVPPEFPPPEISIGLRHARFLAARVTMPKASMNEYGFPKLWQNDVWTAREL
jgi:hypothetical protein